MANEKARKEFLISKDDVIYLYGAGGFIGNVFPNKEIIIEMNIYEGSFNIQLVIDFNNTLTMWNASKIEISNAITNHESVFTMESILNEVLGNERERK